MPTLSPLATLIATLAEVCRQAEQHQPLLNKNEAATRAALIDPVLRALGWDTANVQQVEPERTVENKQSLDYVLKSNTGAIQAVVEAKKLGESLDKLGHVGALIGYAFSLKPISFFITDGLNWHCYSPEHSHYKPIASIEITSGTLLPAALQLLQLLDAAHAGHGLPAPATQPKNQLPASSSFAANTSKVKTTKATSQPVPYSEKHFTELALLSTLALPPGQKPTTLRLPNGTQKPIQTWKDILLEVCRFVLLNKQNLTLPLPDKAGKKRFLFATEKPLVGSSTPASYHNKPLYIYTHYSATDCIANALYAEAQLPVEARQVKVAVAF